MTFRVVWDVGSLSVVGGRSRGGFFCALRRKTLQFLYVKAKRERVEG